MAILEKNPINLLMLLTHNPNVRNIKSSPAKNLSFTVKMGTFGDAKLSRGDLGNQLFQFSAAYAYAWKNKSRVVIELPTSKNGIKLNCFELAGVDQVEGVKSTVELVEEGFSPTDWREASMFFYSNYNDNDVICLEGYFQNWRFAKMVEKDLRECLKFKDSYEKTTSLIFQKIRSKYPECEIISTHFRGFDQSDSAGFHNGSEVNHPPVPRDYYESAFTKTKSRLAAQEKNCKFLVFCNNADLARDFFKNSKFSADIIFAENFIDDIDITGGRTDNDILSTLSAPMDLCLMSKCHSHIISNSSFSWWGAWLANSAHVLAPSRCRYFGEALGRHNLNSLYPPTWEEIWYPPHPSSFVSIENFKA